MRMIDRPSKMVPSTSIAKFMNSRNCHAFNSVDITSSTSLAGMRVSVSQCPNRSAATTMILIDAERRIATAVIGSSLRIVQPRQTISAASMDSSAARPPASAMVV